uniref:Retrotransposable element Tf2 n=1 Tax=Cajanus cajan TaxID=3821 RepID=A0A151R7R0_CAJCA|nr:Retrotransposable element Tf2 [Cajanus cajan]
MSFGDTKLHFSTAYHPQSDGQTEVVNRCLEQYLRAFTADHPCQWHSYLPWVELCYNTTFHSSIGMTPHQALYGTNPKLLPTYIPGSASVEDVDLDLTNRTQIQEQLQDHIARAQARMRKYADTKQMAKSYEVG